MTGDALEIMAVCVWTLVSCRDRAITFFEADTDILKFFSPIFCQFLI